METNFNPAGDIMCELYLEGGGRVGEKEGTPGGGWVGGGVRVMAALDYSCKSS